MKPQLELQISRSALENNLANIRKIVGDCCLIAPVVKANAYGHGLEIVAKVLDEAGADGFCVFTLDEAIRLQVAGVKKPIVVLGPVLAEDARKIVERDIRVLVWETGLLEALNRAAEGMDHPARVHIDIDSGMTRFGVLFGEEAKAFATKAIGFTNVRIEGVMSHFSSSDEEGEEYSRLQLNRFNEFITWFKSIGGTPSICHIANSLAVLRFPESHLQMVRVGRLIYGYSRSENDPAVGALTFHQVLRVVTTISQLKRVPAGTPVGYSRAYIVDRDTTVAVLPAGYAEGVSRFLGNRGEVLVSGRRCKIIGKITMNAMMVDVTDCDNAKEGDEVVLIGGQAGEFISTFEIAELQDTVPYNIVTNFQDSLPRRLVD